MANSNKKGFAKWLETLQQESWQLELLISGFAIFLLLGAYEPLENWFFDIKKILYQDYSSVYSFIETGINLLFITWYLLVVNLIIHVFLRGLWISTIGLRYVSGDIDFETLSFSPKFNQFLRKKLTSFDDYIEQIEKICSVIFAFTFLGLFISISVVLFVFFIGIFTFILDFFGIKDNGPITAILQLSLMFFGVIYLVDFLTFGWIKKQNWLAKFYYPVYRLYSIITLSFLYRPLYYNLIDNKFGRKVSLLVIPYAIFLFIGNFIKIDVYDYIPTYRYSQSLHGEYYDDIINSKRFKHTASIPSKYIDNGFIELFLPYISKYYRYPLSELCPELVPGETGLKLDLNNGTDPRQNLNGAKTLECMSELYQVFINDSLRSDAMYLFHTHPQRAETGLLTILDVAHLPRGAHQITVKVKSRNTWQSDSLVFKNTAIIPFWKE